MEVNNKTEIHSSTATKFQRIMILDHKNENKDKKQKYGEEALYLEEEILEIDF